MGACIHSVRRTRQRHEVTEDSATNAWCLNFGDGNLNNWDAKVSNRNQVRQVSAFRFRSRVIAIYVLTRQYSIIRTKKRTMFTIESIIEAHYDCRRNKRRTVNATLFEVDYECELVRLCGELNARTYKPGRSIAFVVSRPKYREVFAATYRDRIVHHWMCLRLIPLLERHLSPRRFNCRNGRGTHYGVAQLTADLYNVSEGYTRDCWIAEGDIQGFFMSIDKEMLADLTERFVRAYYEGDDMEDLVWVSRLVVMHSPERDCVLQSPKSLWAHLPRNKSLFTNGEGLGVPIGSLTSQTLANLLLWVALDTLLERSGFAWGGYVDDFYVIGTDRAAMLALFPRIRRRLALFGLTLHPRKFYFQGFRKGVRFIGVTVLPYRRYVARRTVHSLEGAVRALERCDDGELSHQVCSVNSYLGSMAHYDSYAIRRYILQHSNIYGRCWVGKRFGKVAIKRRHARLLSWQPTLALAGGVPQGADVALYRNKRPTGRRAIRNNQG